MYGYFGLVSSLISPVGPRSTGVYWLRRAVALIAILAVLLALRWVVFGRGGSGSDVGALPAASSSPTQQTPSTDPTSTGTSSTQPSSGASPAQCADADISVVASTDAASYPTGSTPKLHLKIQNTSGIACYRDIGAGMNELQIKSGGYHVWSSDDCNAGGAPMVTLLQPAESYSVTVTWPGVLSNKGCPANQPLAKSGFYDLYGRNGNVVSSSSSFSLTG